jgi:hypothetical protein
MKCQSLECDNETSLPNSHCDKCLDELGELIEKHPISFIGSFTKSNNIKSSSSIIAQLQTPAICSSCNSEIPSGTTISISPILCPKCTHSQNLTVQEVISLTSPSEQERLFPLLNFDNMLNIPVYLLNAENPYCTEIVSIWKNVCKH